MAQTFDFALKAVNAVTHAAAIRFEFRFTGAAPADAARETRKAES
jgi:hypothetical protein